MKESFIELKLEEGDIYDYEMVNAKFNTDEHLNELLNVDRHMDHHPGPNHPRHLLANFMNGGWYDDSDEENDMDDENDNDEDGSDDDDSWVTEEEEIEFS